MGGPIKIVFEVGQQFGRLTVIGEAVTMIKESKSGIRKTRGYPCKCECGNRKTVLTSELLSGRTRSCGCLHRELLRVTCRTHGAYGSPLYLVLRNMIARCENPANDHNYRHYGGRGIKVCEEWRYNFVAFRDWALANGYKPGLTIERKDVNGNYEPGNCTFVTRKRQALNKRNSRRAEYLGETKTWIEWSLDPRCAVRAKTFIDRMKRGWSFEDSFALPKLKPGPIPQSGARRDKL